MKTLLRLCLLLLAFMPLAARAQVADAGASFDCDGRLYQIRQVGTTTHLFRVDRTVTPYTTVDLKDLGVNLNALGYNQLDGYLYAITYSDATAPVLYRIGANGAQSLGVIKSGVLGTANIPSQKYAGGAIDQNGIFYFSVENGSNSLYRIDLTTITRTSTRVSASAIDLPGTAKYYFYDLAINPLDNELYGTLFEGILYRIVPNALGTSATVTDISSTTAVNNTSHPVGTAFFDAAGTLLVASNGAFNGTDDGNFYIVDVSTSQTSSTWIKITTLPRSTQSDGASCIFPPQDIDVVKSVTTVTSVSNSQGKAFDITYSIKLKNTATEVGVNATNIQVSDFLFKTATSNSANNITFPDATIPNGNTTTNSSILSTTISDDDASVVYASNSKFNGTSGADGTTAGLLATGQTLYPGKTITITLKVRVRYTSTAVVPSAAQLNTAIATSSSAPNVGYRLDAATGTYVPPVDLLAADQSTNSTTLPSSANSDTPSGTPVSFTPGIGGIVFEDVNYGGGNGRTQSASGGVGVSGVTVELYGGTTRQVTTTDADGYYYFGDLNTTTTYTVRVVNNTVKSTREGGATATNLMPVQTYANANKVGGNNPAGVDPTAGTTNTLPTGAQSTVALKATAGKPADASFGFNFDVVVNTNASGQGSLNQFIINSNALQNDNTDLSTGNDLNQEGLTAGVESSIFMIPQAALTNGVAVINQTTALTTITDKNTAIDGTIQTAKIGNTNTTTLGTSTTVGTAATTFSKVNGPEVQITVATNVAGLTITGANATLNGVALYGSNGNAVTISADNATITNNVLGTTAASFADPGTARTAGSQVSITSGSGTTLDNNLIGYAGQSGVTVASAATNVSITNSEVRGNGRISVAADGLTLATSGVNVAKNLIAGNAGMGIDLGSSAGSATITGNTISGNGVGLTNTAPTETAGVRVAGDDNRLTNNVLDSNYGAGILVTSSATTTLISQNSTLKNGTIAAANGAAATGQLGIDLLKAGDDTGKGSSPYASPNADGKKAISGANSLLNYPVITQAVVTNSTNGFLQLTGFAPTGSTIELFVADRTTAAFGQGQTYLASVLEGGTLNGVKDGDAKTGNYSGQIYGLNQGSETNASRFYFSIPLSSLTAAQKSALTTGTVRLTATATTDGNTTSEFSGNILISQNSPLPVELVSFMTKTVKADAVLNWNTASEKNNDHFAVERSFDGLSFTQVGTVAGNGSTSVAHAYTFTDANVGQRQQGTVYYRLRQVDQDGTESLSPVRTVVFTQEVAPSVVAFPNPATTQTTLDLSALPQENFSVSVLDMMGRPVRTTTLVGGTTHQLAVQDLPTGNYLITVRGTATAYTLRLTKN